MIRPYQTSNDRLFREVVQDLVALEPDDDNFAVLYKDLRERAERALANMNKDSTEKMDRARVAAVAARKHKNKLLHDYLRPYIEKLLKEGKITTDEIDQGLRRRGIMPLRAAKWNRSTLNRICPELRRS